MPASRTPVTRRRVFGTSIDPAFPSIRRVGVFVGVMNSHYTGRASFYSIANRVSYVFDFHGPSIAVDTACSASLTAIHLALESLYSGTSDCALAGGVNLIMDPDHSVNLAANDMLSASNACKAFGDQADGLVDGEGVGVIPLKPLARAIANHDHIMVSSGQYGSTLVARPAMAYTVPNPAAQAHLIAAALKRAGSMPAPSGSWKPTAPVRSWGDPIEIRGVTWLLSRRKNRQPRQTVLRARSAKTNIRQYRERRGGLPG